MTIKGNVRPRKKNMGFSDFGLYALVHRHFQKSVYWKSFFSSQYANYEILDNPRFYEEKNIILQSDDYQYKIVEFERIQEIEPKDLEDDKLFLTKNIYATFDESLEHNLKR